MPTTSPFILWFTGLPSSGKTTLSLLCSEWFESIGVKHIVLDGDNVRSFFPSGLVSYTRRDRTIHLYYIGYMCKVFQQKGYSVICSFVSPYKDVREQLKQELDNFIEIFVNTPFIVCQQRDVKGLYKKARQGIIKNFTGVDDVYEEPTNANIVIDTSNESPKQSFLRIKQYLLSKQLVEE